MLSRRLTRTLGRLPRRDQGVMLVFFFLSVDSSRVNRGLGVGQDASCEREEGSLRRVEGRLGRGGRSRRWTACASVFLPRVVDHEQWQGHRERTITIL